MTDAPYQAMPWVLGLGECGRHPPRRRVIQRGRGALAQRLMGALMVVLPATAVESGLLSGLVLLRRACGVRCEGPVHALMTAMLLGPSRLHPLVPDAERDPPDTQLREATEGRRGQGRAVIGANRLRAALLADQALEDGLGLHRLRGESGCAAQQIARVGVRDGERIAIHAVSCAELPFEIGCPHRVRRTGVERRGSRMLRPAPPRLRPKPSRFAAALAGTARGRSLKSGVGPSQIGQDLPRSPTGRQRLGLPQHGGDFWSDAVGTGEGRATLLLEPREALWRVASQPLITGFTTDVEARAPLGHLQSRVW